MTFGGSLVIIFVIYRFSIEQDKLGKIQPNIRKITDPLQLLNLDDKEFSRDIDPLI